MNSSLRRLALLTLLSACPGYAAAAGGTVAILSSGGGAYMEAFSAFQAAYGGVVEPYDISKSKPVTGPDTRTIVAFGGKASVYPYAPDINMVYCMAPGIFIKASARSSKTVNISLIPEFSALFAKLRSIQPELKRLHILWRLPAFSPNMEFAKAEGARQGFEITLVRVENLDALPGALRQTLTTADAFWLPPDPLLITPETLNILKEFSWENHIPFYGSTKGMAREGAAASIGLGFKEIGKAAAAAALRLEAGENTPATIYPEISEITLNASAAKKCGLVFPHSILEEAAEIIP